MAGDSSGNDAHHPERVLDRRGFVKLAGTAGAGLTLGPLLAACGSSSSSDGGSIKIGYVSPETGPLAGFGETDKFVIGALEKQFADGVKTGGDRRKIEVLIRDSQSNSNRAASVTNDLILNDNVNLVLVEGTPDNINPVADACEANGTPCISSVAPWQSYFFGRKGTPDKPFKWTYHFFWGLEDLIGVYGEIWPGVPINKKMGVLWPNDPDRLAFAVWVPQGIWGWIAQRFDVSLLPLRRHYRAAPIRQDEAVESPAG